MMSALNAACCNNLSFLSRFKGAFIRRPLVFQLKMLRDSCKAKVPGCSSLLNHPRMIGSDSDVLMELGNDLSLG